MVDDNKCALDSMFDDCIRKAVTEGASFKEIEDVCFDHTYELAEMSREAWMSFARHKGISQILAAAAWKAGRGES